MGRYLISICPYLVDGDDGLRVIDVSDPTSPKPVGFFDTDGRASEVDFSGDIIYVGDGEAGLFIVRNDFLTSVVDIPSLPSSFSLSQNYPNPFNPTTTINYLLAQNSNVTLKVFNILGQEIQTLVHKTQVAGEYEISWNSRDLPSGLYVYRLQAGQFVETRKMILLR